MNYFEALFNNKKCDIVGCMGKMGQRDVIESSPLLMQLFKFKNVPPR